MSVEIKQGTDPLSREVELSVKNRVIEEKVQVALKEEAKRASIPGFRPGKVPLGFLKQRYGKAIRAQVVQDLARDRFIEVMTDQEVELAGAPHFDVMEDHPGKDLKFKANFEVYPKIEINGLKTLKVQNPVVSITDKDESKVIESLRMQKVSWKEVLLQKHHLLGLHKLTCTNLIEVYS